MGNITSISIFGFIANWSPFFFTFVLLVTLVYFLVTKRWYSEFEGGRPITNKESAIFIINMVLVYIIYGSPVDLLSHILFSFHMLQMAFGYLLIAPLFYAAIPDYLQKYIVSLPVVKQIFAIAKKPLVALILFNGAFSVYHLPIVMDNLKMSATAHYAVIIILFVLALVMFYPIFNKVEPRENHMNGLFKMLYIFGIGMLLTPACALIIFASDPMFRTYTNGDAWLAAMELCVPAGTLESLKGQGMISGPEYFTGMDPIHDQQTGGIIMKIMQEVFFSFMLGFIFFRWYKHERKDEDELTRHSLEEARMKRELHSQFR